MKKLPHGGWHRPHVTPAVGSLSATAIAPKPKPPRDSWWTRQVQSRDEFDQLVAERSRDAGWVGVGSTPEDRS